MKHIELVVAYFQPRRCISSGKNKVSLGIRVPSYESKAVQLVQAWRFKLRPWNTEQPLSPDRPPSSSSLCPLLEECFWRRGSANVGGLERSVDCSEGDIALRVG